MKKVLAVLLAVLMTFSVISVCAAAEDSGATGTVIQYVSTGIPRIAATTVGDVVILQAGDVIRFEEVTAATKSLEIVYHPDAASIKVKDVKNTDWLENKVPQYNLDTTKWELKEGQTVDSLLAKSPNYYKSFYTTADFVKGQVAEIAVTGLKGENAYARDSASVDRGFCPIDYELEGAKFLGWALNSYSTWKANKTDKIKIEVYALWDRDAAPEPENPTEPVDPENPQYDTPIQAALAKVLGFIDQAADWVKALPALVATVLPNWMNGLIRGWLYKLFGIEAE